MAYNIYNSGISIRLSDDRYIPIIRTGESNLKDANGKIVYHWYGLTDKNKIAFTKEELKAYLTKFFKHIPKDYKDNYRFKTAKEILTKSKLNWLINTSIKKAITFEQATTMGIHVSIFRTWGERNFFVPKSEADMLDFIKENEKGGTDYCQVGFSDEEKLMQFSKAIQLATMCFRKESEGNMILHGYVGSVNADNHVYVGRDECKRPILVKSITEAYRMGDTAEILKTPWLINYFDLLHDTHLCNISCEEYKTEETH